MDLRESNWCGYCHVVKNFNYGFLLGTDFVIKTFSRIDLGSMKVTIGQQNLDVSVINQPSQVEVCIVDTIEIPPRSEAMLQGSVSGLNGEVPIAPKHETSRSKSLSYPARIKNGIAPAKILILIVAQSRCLQQRVLVWQKYRNDKKSSRQDKSHKVEHIVFPIRWILEKQSFSSKRPYRITQSQLAMVDKHIEMLNMGISQESISTWSQHLVIITKVDGSPRFCVKLSKLNNNTKQKIFPMPRVTRF